MEKRTKPEKTKGIHAPYPAANWDLFIQTNPNISGKQMSRMWIDGKVERKVIAGKHKEANTINTPK